jgi:RNA polymerase sigma-70 factor (ECF subfamily)
VSRFHKPATTPSVAHESGLLDNEDLVEALRRGDRAAIGALYDQFQPLVERTLVRIVGAEPDLPDLVHEAFLSAMRSVASVRDPKALPAWVMRIAVRKAADWLRRNRRRRWLMPINLPPDRPAVRAEMDTDGAEAVRETYRLLADLPVDERIAFSLRFIDGRELTEVAAACHCSLATIKRRLSRAETTFLKLARQSAVLREWVDEGQRWRRP